MKQPIANIVLKLDKIGSTVSLSNVTPAEMMLLCAMHSANAGGDPIVKMTEVLEVDQEKHLKSLQDELTKVELLIDSLGDIENITEEVREKRAINLSSKVESYQGQINKQMQLMSIRNLDAADEKNRLAYKYNNILLNKFYIGNIPQLPTTFEQARKGGSTLNSGQHDHFLVGAQALQG